MAIAVHTIQNTIQNEIPLLSGSYPVKPFSPEGFVGTVEHDGQTARVSSLAVYEGAVIFLSLVGFDTSVSAIMAQLWRNKTVLFAPEEGMSWNEATILRRHEKASYKQIEAPLPGTKQRHKMALPMSAHIGEGLLSSPRMQEHPKPQLDNEGEQHIPMSDARYLLGNAHEPLPAQQSFLAHLQAMRVILLFRVPDHPEWVACWAAELWQRALARQLVVQLPALGIQIWRLEPDVDAWNALIGQGVREGWLPW